MILAGLYISIACMAYRACGNHLIGSLAFSVGLVLVCVLGADLFTGKIGYGKKDQWPELVITLLVNLSAAALLGAVFPGGGPDKLTVPLLPAFGKAALCGVLVFCAVEGYRRTKSIWMIAWPTATFVLIGGEHCIADAFWISAAGAWSWSALGWLRVVMLGNSIGAIGARVMTERGRRC